MNALVPQKDLTEILDRIIREITLLAAGVRLFPDTAEIGRASCRERV